MSRLASSRKPWSVLAFVVAALVVVPVVFVASSVLRPNTEVWRQQWDTRLPGELVATAVLLIGVAVGTTLLGAGLAWIVSAYRFPGSRMFGWALVLPLAMPTYILGFLVISTFGATGPVQDQWRSWFGADAWFPTVESRMGVIITFTLVLYPYVYLLARAALRDQAPGAYHTARLLGASPTEAARRVVLPLVRPAIAAGVAIVMMETLTDYATVQYFRVDTVMVGVFRIWRGTYDRDAASEIATLVLVFALLVIALERIGRRSARYGDAAGAGSGLTPRRLRGGKAFAAIAVCAAPVLLAFVLPVVRLATWAIKEQTSERGTPMTSAFPEYLSHSLQLAGVTVLVVLLIAILVANARRFGHHRFASFTARLSVVGYAIPGPVVAIGVLLFIVAVDNGLEAVGGNLPGAAAAGSILVLCYAYAVRFLAPGLGAVDAGVEQVHSDMTASARTLGASPWRTMRTVHVPLAKASFAAAGILVAVDALKELPIALLLRPFGFDTLPIWVYNLASESRYEQAALPALAIIAVAAVPVLFLSRILEKAT